MYEDLLENCGLTKNESLVYLSLLRTGKAKSGKVVRDAGISGGKVYETLYKLIDKGLVKFIIENNVKYFIANEPETLLSYMDEREKTLNNKKKKLVKIIPELKLSKKKYEDFEEVSLIKGIRGISFIVYGALEKGRSVKVMGVRSSKDVKFNNFWRAWHRRRVKLKKKANLKK